MTTEETKRRLQSSSGKVKRLAVTIEAGFLYPMGMIKRYCLMQGLDFDLENDGFLFKEYILVVRNITVRDAIALIHHLETLDTD
jgi:hypothetical protein